MILCVCVTHIHAHLIISLDVLYQVDMFMFTSFYFLVETWLAVGCPSSGCWRGIVKYCAAFYIITIYCCSILECGPKSGEPFVSLLLRRTRWPKVSVHWIVPVHLSQIGSSPDNSPYPVLLAENRCQFFFYRKLIQELIINYITF